MTIEFYRQPLLEEIEMNPNEAAQEIHQLMVKLVEHCLTDGDRTRLSMATDLFQGIRYKTYE